MASESKITVRYAETDQMQVVHHAVYPVWFEAARGDYILKCGMSYADIEARGYMIPLHDLTCQYIRPCRYGETVTVVTRILKYTPVKIVFGYEIYMEGEKTPRTKGTTTHAWVRTDNFQMVNLKKEAPDIYEQIASCYEEDNCETS